jgi:hypothetical protein
MLAFILPGAVAANTPTNLPADFPPITRVTSVLVLTEAAGGTASTTSPALASPVVNKVGLSGTTLAAGAFAFDPVNRQWQYGSATTAGTVFILEGLMQGEFPEPTLT